MQHYKLKNPARQAGMTLIELSVVLLILVGLAGLLIPYVSGFMEKTHDSTTVSTIAELNNTVQRYQTTKLGLPSNLDSLIDATSGSTYNKLQNVAIFTVLPGAAQVGGTPTDSSLANASLSKAGVITVLANNNLTDDATFKSTIGSPLTLASNAFAGITTQSLLELTGDATNTTNLDYYGQLAQPIGAADGVKNQLAYAFGGTPASWDTACTKYIVMGVGSSNTMIPDAMQSAPVHFGGSKGEAPATVYDRYVAVFAVPSIGAVGATSATTNGSNPCPKPDAAAKFIGSAGVMDFPAIVGLNGSQQWANSNLVK